MQVRFGHFSESRILQSGPEDRVVPYKGEGRVCGAVRGACVGCVCVYVVPYKGETCVWDAGEGRG